MVSNRNVNAFGTYLDTVLSPAASDQPASALPSAPGMSQILKALASSSPQKVSDLFPVSGLDLQSYAALVQSMQDLKLATVSGQGSDEIMDLTSEGKAAAQHSA